MMTLLKYLYVGNILVNAIDFILTNFSITSKMTRRPFKSVIKSMTSTTCHCCHPLPGPQGRCLRVKDFVNWLGSCARPLDIQTTSRSMTLRYWPLFTKYKIWTSMSRGISVFRTHLLYVTALGEIFYKTQAGNRSLDSKSFNNNRMEKIGIAP